MSQTIIIGRGSAPASAAPAGDPYFSSVKLLMGFPGADASTTFTDESSAAHAMTAVGNAQIDTAQSKFGGSAYLGDGTGDCVTSPDHADWTPAGDFTWELWVRFNSVAASQCLISQWSSSPAQRAYEFQWSNSNTLNFLFSTDGSATTTIAGSWTPSIDTWYFLSVSRVGNDWVTHVDGIVNQTLTNSGAIFDSNQVVRIGAIFTSSIIQSVNGWVDEVRFTNGVGRYTNVNYTPPTEAFPRS